MRVKGEGLAFFIEFQPARFVPPKNQAYLYYPGFRFRSWKSGVLANLPVPAQSFGLDLSFTSFGDEGVKELAAFKSIYILNISSTPLTEAGRKELQRTVHVNWISR